jgi:hypothetical protein
MHIGSGRGLNDYMASFANSNYNALEISVEKRVGSLNLLGAYYLYDLPFQKLIKAQDGALYKTLDGWRLGGIARFATGLPVTLTESGDLSLCGCGGADRPNYTGGPINFFDPRSSATH